MYTFVSVSVPLSNVYILHYAICYADSISQLTLVDLLLQIAFVFP